MPSFNRFILAVGLLGINTLLLAADPQKPKRPAFENKHFRIHLVSRTPGQIAAFYTGRGFPKRAIEELKQACFITIGVRNKGTKKVWLDLSNWQLVTSDGPVKRIMRAGWRKRWQELGLEKRFQATFRWTLMPEKLDFYPHEGEGGNITIPYTEKSITLKATIKVGNHKPDNYDITIENIHCGKDPS